MNFDQISPKSMEYLAKIAESPNKFEELTLQFITNRESDNLKVPEFSDKYEWLNTSDKLSFDGNLKKKLCVLDFFTYCCINCMHVLPQLHELESKHSIEDGLAVIGVHSAKFPNEKVVDNILSAVLRYDISHPVLNDGEAELWNAMSIRCWPTFVIVSPEGIPLLYLVGETHKETLFKFVEIALKYYGDKGMISNHTLPISLAKDNLKTGLLKFPGKIAIDKNGTHFAVSNTGNHNILLFDDTGIVYSKIGTGTPGFVNGGSAHAQFNAPQGLAWHGDDIYVADTENHAIRKIDATTGSVTTITGTGLQGDDKEGGKSGTEQEISSPWDVEFASAPGVDQEKEEGPKNCMYIAAAGTHQIWSYFLEDGSWLKKGSQTERTCIRFAGSGNEENRNNSYPHKASFAQPSHLSLGKVKGQNVLFVADSESSSVRTVELKSGAVKACVGGERDPMNLFAYGDQDGKSVDAKLQHPLAVAYDQQNDVVYVADSYNHKIKKIEASKNTCSTLTIRGGVGSTDGQMAECQFNEPGGLALHPNKRLLYVADTNNHRIRVIDLEKNTCSTLPLIESDSKDSPVPLEYKALVNIQRNPPTVLEKITRDLSSVVSTRVQLVFPEHLHFTEGVNSKVQLSLSDMDGEVISFESGEIEREKKTFGCNLSTHHANKELLLKVEMILYVCIGESCMMKSYLIQQHVTHDVTSTNDVIGIEHQVVV